MHTGVGRVLRTFGFGPYTQPRAGAVQCFQSLLSIKAAGSGCVKPWTGIGRYTQ